MQSTTESLREVFNVIAHWLIGLHQSLPYCLWKPYCGSMDAKGSCPSSLVWSVLWDGQTNECFILKMKVIYFSCFVFFINVASFFFSYENKSFRYLHLGQIHAHYHVTTPFWKWLLWIWNSTFNFIHDTELLNANTTINLMSKTFVVKPREKPQFIYVEFTFFIWMFIVLCLSITSLMLLLLHTRFEWPLT